MRALCIAGRSWATWYQQHNYQHVLGKESACEPLRWRSAGVQQCTSNALPSPLLPPFRPYSNPLFLLNSFRSQTRSSITIHPVVLFSILDDYLSRNDEQPRVIGTLLGTRSPDNTQIHVRSSFAVLQNENEEQVAVDMEYHRAMYELHSRVMPKETIVGWYSTGLNLNTYPALIQNFYSQETAPHQAIHVALNTGAEDSEEAGVQAYVSSPVRVFPKPENCIFVPVPVRLQFQDAERSGRAYPISSS
ncbi:JAB1/Mov34/MPN/PAD-1 ubiquitin protease-domain-containing protein [Mycena galopus ATCC 62051]|nr:JAB1/Mov34/MPN/PAD-1 ubiquitin protease-domain-containing protein [Mycena galopus ATCC 62051]